MADASPMIATRVAADTPGPQALLLLHGIYGRGRNWLAVARQLIARRPDWSCWLGDMRHHGDAGDGPGGETLHVLAGDVDAWAATAGVTPRAVLGHSFGGKVALAYAARHPARALQTWVVDSTPDAKAPGGSAWDMLAIVKGLPPTFRTRQDAIAGIEAGGFSTGVAQWMSTNLVRDGDTFRWRLDFAVMERLLHEFFDTPLWHVLDPGAAPHDIHVIKATQSSVISPEAVARLRGLEARDGDGHARVHLHELEGGHWIHAESPEAIVDLLADFLPR